MSNVTFNQYKYRDSLFNESDNDSTEGSTLEEYVDSVLERMDRQLMDEYYDKCVKNYADKHGE